MLTCQTLINKPKKFKQFTSLTIDQFQEIEKRFTPLWNQSEYLRLSRNTRKRAIGGGHPYHLKRLADRLLVLLMWYRMNIQRDILGWIFHLDATNIGRLISRLTPLLEKAADPSFIDLLNQSRRKRKKITSIDELITTYPDLAEIIIDATEQHRERPGKKRAQKKVYSGKKHAHTVKTQIAVSQIGRILDVSRSYPGRIHDKTILMAERTLDRIPKDIPVRMDKGYDGIHHDYPDHMLILPLKRRRNSPALTTGQKRANTIKSKLRIIVENVLCRMKKYKVLDEKYRYDNVLYNQHVRNVAALCNFRLLYSK